LWQCDDVTNSATLLDAPCCLQLAAALVCSPELLDGGIVELGREDSVAKIVNKMDTATGTVYCMSAIAEFTQTATLSVGTQKCFDVRDPDRSITNIGIHFQYKTPIESQEVAEYQ
jgi:hypothetical protein